MSIRILRDQLKEEDIKSFEKNLIIEEEIDRKKKNWMIPSKINLVKHDDLYVYLPFYWGIQYYGKSCRKNKHLCEPLKINFKASLRTEQKNVLNETVDLLNRNSTALIAMYPGAGKCLVKGTKILLWNGNYKKVEDITIYDQLVGDDNTIRNIYSLGNGIEQIYKISHSYINEIFYEVNESHILTLYNTIYNKIIDISLLSFIQLSTNEQSNYLGIYRKIKTIDENFLLQCKSIHNNQYLYQSSKLYIENDLKEIMLMGFNILSILDYNIIFQENEMDYNYYPITIKKTDIKEYFGFEIDKNGRFLLWNGIITHNTITSLALSATIGLRTFILVNKIILINQWEQAIKQCFGEHIRYQIVKSKSKLQMGCHFYIMNALNVPKKERSEYESLKIGLVIIDECHLIMTKIFSLSLSYLCPRYLIGLSATPFRPDGFDKLLDLNFGIKKIERKLFRKHTVYWIDNPLKIKTDLTDKGDIIWNSVIDQQCDNKDRNNFIINICTQYKNRNILILTKRIKHIEYLKSELENINENVTTMTDSGNFDKNARILISTYQKVGTGFSHESLDMLILGTDTEEYFLQYLGRVFRTPIVEPIIFDIVDKHPILKRHFLTRRKVYLDSGGTIINYNDSVIDKVAINDGISETAPK